MSIEVTVVRIYLTEGNKLLKAVMNYLHDEVQVRGVTVFRAIAGFGSSGVMHSSQLLELSLDLPLVVEFFDTNEKIAATLEKLKNLVGGKHIIHWKAIME